MRKNIFFLRLLFLLSLLYGCTQVIEEFSAYDWPAGDEYWHYSYSERLLNSGITERESVVNYNSPTPVVVLNVLSSQINNWLIGEEVDNKRSKRSPQLFWYLFLLLNVYLVAYKYLGGEISALIACSLTALDPSLFGHSGLIGTDLPFAAMCIAVLLAIFDYQRNKNYFHLAKLALVFSVSLLVKYVAIFLLPFVLFALVFISLFPGEKINLSKRCLRFIGHSLIFIIIFLIVVNLGYGFNGTGQSMSAHNWYSELFQNIEQLIGNVPLPLPIDFMAGFDQQLTAERVWSWNVVILGDLHQNGVWYYFILCWILKTPIATLITVVFAFAAFFNRHQKIKNIGHFIFCAVLFSYFFLYFSLIFRTQVGMRYSFMCLPLSYLLIANLLNNYPLKKLSYLAILLFVLMIAELFPFWGNGISFTNQIVSPKESVYKWLDDSNVDWFHNYISAHKQANNKLQNYYFNPPHILPGNNIFTVNTLAGVMFNFDQHKWIRKNLKADEHFAFTTIGFKISQEIFNQFMHQERTYLQPQNASILCSEEYEKQLLQDGELPILIGSWSNERLYSACLFVEEPLRLEVKVKSGRAKIGVYPNEHDCQGTEAGAGESLWFDFKRGVQPICAKVMDNLVAEIIIHQGTAKSALRIYPTGEN